ncbi:hypothetical protein ACQ4PT_056857 [Festuca glaucescens]
MGKNRMTTSSGATASAAGSKAPSASRKAGATTKNLDWTASSISKRDKKKLRTLGLISSDESDFIHLEPESGAAPEDDDISEETEENPDVVEDSDASEEEEYDDDMLLTARRRRRVDDDLIETAESIPSRHNDDDADVIPPNAPVPEASAAPRKPSGFFADEDDLMSISSDEDADLPPSKKAKVSSDKLESTKGTMPLSFEDEPIIPPPPRKVVTKVKASFVAPSASTPVPPASNDHPIHATVDIVVDFADQFVRMKAENACLREAAKSSTEKLEKANNLTAEAQKEAASLRKELNLLKERMKEEEQLRLEAHAQADKKEGDLRKSIESLLGVADMSVDRTKRLRVDSMSDALSFAVDSSEQIQELLKKTKGTLSKLFLLMFPKLDQNKTLGELVNTFFVDSGSAIEVLKRHSRLYGAVLAFQLLMGYGFESDLERLTKALPKNEDGLLVDLGLFNDSARVCASQLLKLVDDEKKKTASKAAPSSSAQTQAL